MYLLECLHFSIHRLIRQLDTMNRRTLYHWQPLFRRFVRFHSALALKLNKYARIVNSIACISRPSVNVRMYATMSDVGLFYCVIFSLRCRKIRSVQRTRTKVLSQTKANDSHCTKNIKFYSSNFLIDFSSIFLLVHSHENDTNIPTLRYERKKQSDPMHSRVARSTQSALTTTQRGTLSAELSHTHRTVISK